LREGEYQYDLAKTIASFQLELHFPDAKDMIKRSYGEEKADDIQFRRKIQTILKKMERNGVVRILPKKKPWELQRYALSSLKFRDVENNRVILAKDQQIKKAQNLLRSILRQKEKSGAKISNLETRIFALAFILVASYMAIIWDLMQHSINPFVFIPAFSIGVACSLVLGKTLSKE
jgi:hypothetical protein